MILQREFHNFALVEILRTISEQELENALKSYLNKNMPNLLKQGEKRPFKPFMPIQMTGEGPTASEMVIQDRD